MCTGAAALRPYNNARYYDPALGRFVQPDSIVPNPGDPQSLNRYAYVFNNPLKYTDPTGYCPPWLCNIIMAAAVELVVQAVPQARELRRQQVGGGVVRRTSLAIESAAARHGVDATVVSAILYHESTAFERRVLSGQVLGEPGTLANLAEGVEARLRGDGRASIGPAQMQVRRAEELERLGYVTPRASADERISALLSETGSVEYATGMVKYLSDQMSSAFSDWREQSLDTQRRILLIGYNYGWEGPYGLQANIAKHGYRTTILDTDYDDQTLDDYLRWRSRQ